MGKKQKQKKRQIFITEKDIRRLMKKRAKKLGYSKVVYKRKTGQWFALGKKT